MIAYLFYTKGTPGQEEMMSLADELKRAQVDSELIEADSPRGIALAENYDILIRPSIVLATDRGELVNQWQDPMPSVSDISYWAHR
jgi:hypothetical protein